MNRCFDIRYDGYIKHSEGLHENVHINWAERTWSNRIHNSPGEAFRLKLASMNESDYGEKSNFEKDNFKRSECRNEGFIEPLCFLEQRVHLDRALRAN